ncbi:MAG: class I SAM-dependent methyltransferase family protein [bacterium]|nr:class I SAM-dependent methyltransferase family protein [bacterium]
MHLQSVLNVAVRVKSVPQLQIVEKIPVVIDRDINISYENNWWLYCATLPIMWVLTFWVILKKKIFRNNLETNTLWFDGLSKSCRQVKEGAASWHALDVIYNFPFGRESKVGDYWFGMMNAQAVRNRLKIVKRELMSAIEHVARTNQQIRLLSLACGSAQAVIEIMAEMKELDIRATVVDLDPTAIDYARTLAKQYGIEDKITFIVGGVSNVEKVTNGARPHIIEMVGFLDYRPDAKAVRLVSQIHKSLLPNGIFLTGNTCPNLEQHFLRWVINWSMIYRKPKVLGDIITKAGFLAQDCRIFCEPLGIHAVAVCRKFV